MTTTMKKWNLTNPINRLCVFFGAFFLVYYCLMILLFLFYSSKNDFFGTMVFANKDSHVCFDIVSTKEKKNVFFFKVHERFLGGTKIWEGG